MRTLMYSVDHLEEVIPIGIAQENDVTEIWFDCTSFINLYGDGNAEVIHRRPKEVTGYHCEDVRKEGNYVIWNINNDDTAIAGVGQAQIRWYVGEKLRESIIVETAILPAITSAEDPPAEVKSALDLILQYVNDNTISIEDLNGHIEEIFSSDIEGSVRDWLDEHPEATTTVMDGTITESKLASDVKNIFAEIEDDIDANERDVLSRVTSLQNGIDSNSDNISTLQTRVNSNSNDISVLSSRMDAFSSLEEGSTTGDAELMDIRVGADGVTRSTAGDAVRGQVGDLKSIIDAITPNDVSLSWTLGYYIDNNGTNATNRYVAMTNIVPVTAGDVIVSNTPKRDASNKLLLLYGNTYKNGVWQERVTMFDNSNTYKVEGDVDGIVIIFGRTSSSNVDISNQDIETYFDLQLYTPIADDTLSVTGKAAESVATKNLILKNVPVRTASFCSWEYGKTIYGSGEIASYARSALSEMISVHGGVIRNLSPNEYDSENALITWVIFYTNDQFVKRIGLAYDDTLIVPQDIDSIRFVFTFKSNSTIGSMRFDTLTKFFRVQIQENVGAGDGQRPTYVAIGASTTVGAIHHYDGMPITYTPYAYPNYIGEILGLNTYNLGEGSTGFMARNSGRQPNFMDVLYNNDSIFKEADLITLMFGYGNDKIAGLPVGQWDDYYPYDQEGFFYIEGDTANNDAGMQSMLTNGATLMGCLNWMIKWIGEKYPQALLLCISSAPSGNSGNTAIVSGNKIVVTNNGSALSAPLQTLKEHLNIPIIDLFVEGLPFSYYASKATNDDGTYSIFSTKGTAEDKVWNSHPNDVGYLIYARFLAGVISRYFRH